MTVDGQPEATVSCTPVAVVVRTPSVDRNRILKLRLPQRTVDVEIEKLLAPFQTDSIPVSWYLDDASTPRTLADSLPAHGVSFQYIWRIMERPLADGLLSRYIPDVTVVPAVSGAERALWAQVVLEGFGLSQFRDIQSYLLVTGQLSGRWHRLMAVSRGVPVGGVLLFAGNGVAGLHWLGVPRAWRKHGIGSNLVAAACADALRMGYSSIVLQCDAQLLPLYNRLGFSETGQVAVFEWRPGIVNGAGEEG